MDIILELEKYRLHLLENETSKNTIKNYLTTLKQLDKYLVGNHFELSKETLINYKEELINGIRKNGKPYALKTINQKIIVMNIYFNWSNNHELALKTLKTQLKTHRDSINNKEYRLLLKHADEEMRAFILLIGNTGLRISEVCSIRFDDLEKKIIPIKNKGKTRYISIPQFLKKNLKSYCKKNKIKNVIFYKTQPFYRQSLKRIAGKAKVNKNKVYPHSIRHFFAKEFIANGGDSTELQQMLGHENIATTTIYTKLSSDELSERFRSIRNI